METSTTDPTLLMLIGGIVVLLAGLVAYGVYSTFGSGSKELRDTIDEHAKMHELGIAHGHGGSSGLWNVWKTSKGSNFIKIKILSTVYLNYWDVILNN